MLRQLSAAAALLAVSMLRGVQPPASVVVSALNRKHSISGKEDCPQAGAASEARARSRYDAQQADPCSGRRQQSPLAVLLQAGIASRWPREWRPPHRGRSLCLLNKFTQVRRCIDSDSQKPRRNADAGPGTCAAADHDAATNIRLLRSVNLSKQGPSVQQCLALSSLPCRGTELTHHGMPSNRRRKL